MEPVSGANGDGAMSWPVMDAVAAILSSHGDDRDRTISEYGFVLWNEDGGEILSVGTGASVIEVKL